MEKEMERERPEKGMDILPGGRAHRFYYFKIPSCLLSFSPCLGISVFPSRRPEG